MVLVTTLSLSGCSRNAGEASSSSSGAATPDPNKEADTTRNDGYKADSITQTYPIPR